MFVCVLSSMHLFESCPFLSWLVLLLVGHVNVMNIIMLFSKNPNSCQGCTYKCSMF